MTLKIREAKTDQDKLEIYRLRYQIYVRELNLVPEFVNHVEQTIKEPFDDYAHNFLAETEKGVVGALRVILRKDGAFEYEDLYDFEPFKPYYPGEISMTSKFIVHPQHHGNEVAKSLVDKAYEFIRKEKSQYNFLNCWPHLINLYEHLGYRQYGVCITHPDEGFTTPLVLVCEDLAYFIRISSPFAGMAQSFDNSDAALLNFEKNFPQYAKSELKLQSDHKYVYDLLSEKMSGTLGDTVNLFKDMSGEEIHLVKSLGRIARFKTGEKIIKFGQTTREIYTLLSGQVEVCHEMKGVITHIASFTEGETFGEVAHLAEATRSADVIAVADCDVLVHDSRMLENLEKNFPTMAAKIYRNLARIVSIRLIKTSQTASALRASLCRKM